MKKSRAALLWDLFITFFKIGAFTIGGGLAMLPIIEREIVDNKQYISKEEIVDAFAISQSLPGVIAINSAFYIGYRIAGIAGAVVTAIGVILPSFISILAIAILFDTVSGNVYVSKALTGIKAGVAGVIAVTVVRLGKSVIKDWFALILAVLAFAVTTWLDVSIVFIIAAGALAGYLYYQAGRVKRHDTD
ncbi:MAG TPA: chromate transporter [Thermoclostridium caenicola]|uniref:Chromate transporter n=1 Tax=Thermoclostridium caenicola TaxID=659425 RepID=A0A1M6IYR2_9FIRM|nr:chromate transporter [Thermoclostridium caenicola]SHJ39594.1 chromate transporter [Thermoclostridium caenicola]HOK43579.1 chromate transporter [Thermoclostridium caenicola]HOL85581.1 chromate transporter [Thermoclostridium caenicola]HPO77219.1 chromate transporter [Thermoclostridium caenicola]